MLETRSANLYDVNIKWLNISVKMTLSNTQLNKLKSATKNVTEVTLRSSSNLIGTCQNAFQHNL